MHPSQVWAESEFRSAEVRFRDTKDGVQVQVHQHQNKLKHAIQWHGKNYGTF